MVLNGDDKLPLGSSQAQLSLSWRLGHLVKTDQVKESLGIQGVFVACKVTTVDFIYFLVRLRSLEF